MRVLKLDESVYREISDDPAATRQSLIVTASAVLIGFLIGPGNLVERVAVPIVLLTAGLFIWTAFLFGIGRLFKGTAGYIQLVRPIGFAAAPFALLVIPVVGAILGFAYSLLIQVRVVKSVHRLGLGPAFAIVLIPVALAITPTVIAGKWVDSLLESARLLS